jgi:hypothetical protein
MRPVAAVAAVIGAVAPVSCAARGPRDNTDVFVKCLRESGGRVIHAPAQLRGPRGARAGIPLT